MTSKEVQKLIRGQFLNAVILRMWDNNRCNRGNVQQGQNKQIGLFQSLGLALLMVLLVAIFFLGSICLVTFIIDLF